MTIAERTRHVLLAAHAAGASAALLRSHANFAWFTGGADNRVDRSAEAGVAGVLVTEDGPWVVTDEIEAERLCDEEVDAIPVAAHPWYEDPVALVRELAGGRSIATDVALPGLDAPGASHGAGFAEDLRARRMVLDEQTIARYVHLGDVAQSAVDRAIAGLGPADTERDVAARVLAELTTLGIASPVLLCAGASRIEAYRHPLPTDAPLGERFLVVVCAERGGLYANLSRTRELAEPAPALQRRAEACEHVLRELHAASRPGVTLAELHDRCRALYAEAGLGDEWRRHHQGGLTGFRPREIIATPHTSTALQPGHALAWNPSAPGVKAEETFVVREHGTVSITAHVR